MIDIHNHALYSIDDGSRNLEESLGILADLESRGFETVICTPHYIENTEFVATNAKKKTLLDNLQKAAKKAGLKIKLELGNEAFVSDKLSDYIAKNKVQTINKNYLLFELPLTGEIKNLNDIIYNLKFDGYNLILAHPERYKVFQQNPKLLELFHKQGVEIQSNFGSIIGKYGKNAKKMLKYLLRHHLVDYFGTDIHRPNSEIIQKFPKIERKLKHYAGKKYYQEIINNAQKLIGEKHEK